MGSSCSCSCSRVVKDVEKMEEVAIEHKGDIVEVLEVLHVPRKAIGGMETTLTVVDDTFGVVNRKQNN